ncbi:hypothetical protein Acid345_4089 [Candidatus Koribacter versatilis Ellin345]|uniref:Uncharacterized protein n=1 Tax=Koribacter versatilis (strain Ellin345) TaxID=204669 RepID=Q1IJ61_KORVE|nr:hypothetical protein [Candidatus Koribacter versatilis]ABF43089.1 hypothetical protein Acid345_4089 [Candidatus Koribacter versatilis Ellin345]
MNRIVGVLCAAMLMGGTALAQTNEAAATVAQPTVPRLIRFAGQIAPEAAPSSTVARGITFSLYRSENDTSALWTETQNVSLEKDGKYTVLLGATKSEGLPADIFTSGEAQWLGIRVEGSHEKRVLLVSVPYALRAAQADTLAGHPALDFVTTDKLTTVVKEQIAQQTTTLGKGRTAAGAIKNAVSATPTNFTGSTTDQIVGVTQSSTGMGINVSSGTGYGVYSKSTGSALYGVSTSTSLAAYGVFGSSASAAGYGVFGSNTSPTGTAVGIRGTSSSPGGIAVYGTANTATGTATGVKGITQSPDGYGVFGQNTATTGVAIGFRGSTASTAGVAIYGTATATTGATTGMRATVASANGVAALFLNSAHGKLLSGIVGTSTEVFSVDGAGNIVGGSLNASFVQGASTTLGIFGGLFSGANGGGTAVSANGGAAAASATTAGAGLVATGGTLASGVTNATGGDGADFYGGDGDSGTGNGVSGTGGNVANAAAITGGYGGYFIGGGPNGDGLYAAPSIGGTGNAATLDGNVTVTGLLTTSSAARMQIDDPLDPESKILEHSGIQSSELLNVYSGNATIGANGRAAIKLPAWFEAVNTDFRYQLTPIGAPASLYVSAPIAKGAFEIAGGTPGMTVSWQITAVRKDPYHLAHPLQVETDKTAAQRGLYLHPEAYGASPDKRLGAVQHLPTNRKPRAAKGAVSKAPQDN